MRNRLQAIDPVYQNYRVTFERLVSFINDNTISLVAYFKKFDRDGSGKLSKNEFHSALTGLGFKINTDEM